MQKISLADFRSSVSARVASYKLGPMNPASVTTFEVVLPEYDPDEPPFLVLHPGLPATILQSDAFRVGAGCGYYGCSVPEVTLPTQIANMVHKDVRACLRDRESYAFTLGFLLGYLTLLAQVDRLLAYVGIAHLCFQVEVAYAAFFSENIYLLLNKMDVFHSIAVDEHRAQWQCLKEQGFETVRAARLALRLDGWDSALEDSGQDVATLRARRSALGAQGEMEEEVA